MSNLPAQVTTSAPATIALCCFAIIAALVGGVGIPDGLVVRHLVQTAPLWVAVVLGLCRSRATGWLALPLFLFWLTVMALIWLYLLGIAHVLSGHFSPLEIAMTIVVGIASVAGIAAAARFKSRLSAPAAAGLFVIAAVIQWACFRISFFPAIAHH
ncbi:MAG: hypothetical protein WBE86_03960 [Candidatus Acidiferrales bacterium]